MLFPCMTSDMRSLTKSQARSLLSRARLNRARSRRRLSNWRRIRIAQTSFGFSGGFCPMSLPLFHGTWVESVALVLSFQITSSPPKNYLSLMRFSSCNRVNGCARKFTSCVSVICLSRHNCARFAPRSLFWNVSDFMIRNSSNEISAGT